MQSGRNDSGRKNLSSTAKMLERRPSFTRRKKQAAVDGKNDDAPQKMEESTPTVATPPTARRWFRFPSSSKRTENDRADTVDETVDTPSQITFEGRVVDSVKQNDPIGPSLYRERLQRARSAKRMATTTQDLVDADDVIPEVADESMDAPIDGPIEMSDDDPVAEGVYVKRNGHWYDLDGNPMRPRRVIRFVWKKSA